jgi:hypothetical protein
MDEDDFLSVTLMDRYYIPILSAWNVRLDG